MREKILGSSWLSQKKVNPFRLISPAHPSASKRDSHVVTHQFIFIYRHRDHQSLSKLKPQATGRIPAGLPEKAVWHTTCFGLPAGEKDLSPAERARWCSAAPALQSFLPRHPAPFTGPALCRLPGAAEGGRGGAQAGRPAAAACRCRAPGGGRGPPRAAPQPRAEASAATKGNAGHEVAAAARRLSVGGARASPCGAPAGPQLARGGNGRPNRPLGAAAGLSPASLCPVTPCPVATPVAFKFRCRARCSFPRVPGSFSVVAWGLFCRLIVSVVHVGGEGLFAFVPRGLRGPFSRRPPPAIAVGSAKLSRWRELRCS